MPSYGEIQQPAGMKKDCGCDHSCSCSIPENKKMVHLGVTAGFKIEAPTYKGNAALNAQRVK
jgi:hypothetical protein